MTTSKNSASSFLGLLFVFISLPPTDAADPVADSATAIRNTAGLYQVHEWLFRQRHSAKAVQPRLSQ